MKALGFPTAVFSSALQGGQGAGKAGRCWKLAAWLHSVCGEDERKSLVSWLSV